MMWSPVNNASWTSDNRRVSRGSWCRHRDEPNSTKLDMLPASAPWRVRFEVGSISFDPDRRYPVALRVAAGAGCMVWMGVGDDDGNDFQTAQCGRDGVEVGLDDRSRVDDQRFSSTRSPRCSSLVPVIRPGLGASTSSTFTVQAPSKPGSPGRSTDHAPAASTANRGSVGTGVVWRRCEAHRRDQRGRASTWRLNLGGTPRPAMFRRRLGREGLGRGVTQTGSNTSTRSERATVSGGTSTMENRVSNLLGRPRG